MRVLIEVTAEDIAQSPKRGCGNGGDCPVWRAARRVFPDISGLWVTAGQISAESPGAIDDLAEAEYLAELPEEAEAFIASYDGEEPGSLDPFIFEIEVDERWLVVP